MKILPALLLCVTSSASGFGQDHAAKPPFTIAIAGEQATVKSGADVWIRTRLTNNSEHDLDMSGSYDDSIRMNPNYIFDVRDSTGKPCAKVISPHPEVVTGSPNNRTVKAGETYITEQRISALYNMNSADKYLVQVSRRASENPEDGIIPSNKITITVEPADQPFSIAISTATPVIKVGSELRVAIKLTNTTDHTITSERTVSSQTAEFSYSIEVFDSSGKSPPETAYFLCYHFIGGDATHVCARIASFIQFPLKPGESLDDEALITNLYDLHIPGKYLIQVSRSDFDNPNSKAIKSNILAVTVTD